MWLIKFLGVYLPVEEFVLKWLPINDQYYQWLRQIPDFIILFYAFTLIFYRAILGLRMPKIGNGCDLFLVLFLVSTILSYAVNPTADFIIWLLSVKALVRYILIIYIIMILGPTNRQINSVINWITFAIGCQIFIGFFQYLGGISARDILAARRVTEGVGGIVMDFTGDRFEGVNDLFGTMGNTINYAYFMLIGLSIWIFSSKFNSFKYWIITSILFVFIYLTGSRASMLAALLLILGSQKKIKGWVSVFKILLIFIFLISPLYLLLDSNSSSPYDVDTKSISSLFTEGYLEAAMNQRLGIIVYIVPNIIFGFENIFGFVSAELVVEFIKNKLPMVPEILTNVLILMIDDVYWVAIYLYYGVVGFGFIIAFLIAIFNSISLIRKQQNSETSYKTASIAINLLIILVPLNFLNQALVTRSFSYYLWVFCGLAFASANLKTSLAEGK
jgi:hypothetical protein